MQGVLYHTKGRPKTGAFSHEGAPKEALFDKLRMLETPVVVETESILVDLATDFALAL
jgi:hypothetical protein